MGIFNRGPKEDEKEEETVEELDKRIDDVLEEPKVEEAPVPEAEVAPEVTEDVEEAPVPEEPVEAVEEKTPSFL